MRFFVRSLPLGMLLLLNFAANAQSKITYNEKTGADAASIWPGAEHVWLKQENTIPAFIQFRQGQEPTEQAFFAVLQKLYQLPANYSFNQIGLEKDQLGWEHKRMQVMVNGVAINNGIFILHLVNGKVKKYNGYLFKNVVLSTAPTVSEANALNSALANINAQTYKWQIPAEEEFIKQKTGDNGATYYPKGRLEIIQLGGNASTNFRLAWKFDVYASAPLSRNYVYVDAQTGVVLNKVSRIQDANANGTAVTVYRGNKAIVADSYQSKYRLYETTRGNGIHTLNMQTGTNYGNAVEFLDNDNYWNNVNTAKDQYAGDAHWGGEMTYDFYKSFNRNSIDNNGFALTLYVHYDQAYLNAFWDGQEMNFGDGSTGYTPLTSLDITGHEISHGLDQYTANLTYQNESGALNESFSDIFGTAVEWFADSTRGNWLIGEDIGTAFRSMSNPKTYGDPDTYTGQNWYTGTQDNGGVHTNSNVQNHWDYILSDGASGTNDLGNAYNVTGITRHKATQIAWRNMVNYLTASADYADSRFYSIQAATDLFGACSQEVISTTKAWYAVGVGADFTYGVSAQFTASPTSGCTTPTTVNFTNTSSNASTYSWSFGDSGTSTAQNPSHTYNALGTYTVKLVANGGACGIDSLTRTNYISISTSNPCVVILPSNGTYQTQTSCTGTVYDDGGPSANYSDLSNGVVTISPTGASKVKLHFTQFGMENGYDYLYVYDGPSTASPIIGSYTGNTIPADITSTGGSITLRQSSDNYVNGVGFTIQWTCISPNSPPVADFTADATQTCTGAVQFTDLSTGGATSWSWNFGDGFTSTQQNPFHQYNSNGTFTVALTATNTFGSNTKTKTSYITVNKPAAPSASNVSSCGPSSFSLSSTVTNPVSWLDSSGNVVSSSNPFVTPVLTSTRTYWLIDSVPQTTYHVGPASDNIGQGGYFTNASRALRFTVNKKSTLVSVYIYANGAGYRTIQYRDTSGGVIAQRTVNCPNGGSRITLNIDLIPGGPYELGLRDTVNLYRNSSGAVYPYTDANNTVSITGNNAGSGATAYYYFFYDWIVKEQNCVSLKQPVTATVNPALTIANSSSTNVDCNGNATGSASVTLGGGTPNFTYRWSNGQTNATAVSLVAGTYTLTATDAVGCSATISKIVTQPNVLAPSASVTNVSCNGANNGSISLSVSGGTSSYSYNWGSGITSQNRTGLSPGTYTVTVTDSHFCTATTNGTITQPAVLTASLASTNVSCFNGTNGTITSTVGGGTTSYSYNWGSGTTTPNRTAVGAGAYVLTVTDAHSCTATASATITQPAALTAAVAPIATTCGLNNGSAAAIVSGGTPNYQYNWGGGVTTANRTNLSAGTYRVTVTDNNLCTISASATVTNSSALSTNTSTINVLCFGDSTGSATVNVNNATQPVQYSWSNAGSTATISNIAAGTYTVSVTDAANCTASASASVTQSTALTVILTPVNVSCYGGSNGSINTNPGGGQPSYTYDWGNNITVRNRNNLTAGTYTVIVTDSHNCTATAATTVTQPTPLTAAVIPVATTCGQSNGAVSTLASGGTPNYLYIWGNGNTNQNRTGLTSGSYTVTVTDGHTCTTTATAVVGSSTALSISESAINVDCYGAATGSASVSANNGQRPYVYNWSNSGNGVSINNLLAGTYTVTVTDASNCSATATKTVTQPAQLVATITSVNAGCNGSSDGSATANVTGGTTSYGYQWTGGATTQVLSNLAEGTYNLTVTDAHSCTATATTFISASGNLALTTTATNVTCYGTATGAATVNANGTAPYHYNWSNTDTVSSINNVPAGVYDVTVVDALGCSTTTSQTVTEPAELTVSITTIDASCGVNNGSATATPSGGTPGLNTAYTYQWLGGGGNAATDGNLYGGNYAVIVTDGNGCTVSGTAVINNSGSLSLNATPTATNCHGDSTGTATVSSNGVAPITYAWSTAATTQAISNLPAGTYLVTVSDVNGCTGTAATTVSEPSQLSLTTQYNNPSCNGFSDGSTDVTATGGTAGYTYLWSDQSTGTGLSNLSQGTYSVIATDAHTCTTSASFILIDPAAIAFNPQVTDTKCYNDSSGNIITNATGGTPTFTYLWSNNATTADLHNVPAGNYSVILTDNHQCTAIANFTVNQPAQILVQDSATNSSNGINGTASVVSISNGTTPFTFMWNNSDTAQNITGLTPGTYTVTVTDANGCTALASTIVHTVTGLSEINAGFSFNVYPNPAYNNLVISISKLQPGTSLSLKNVLGQNLFTNTVTDLNTQIDVSGFAAGVYVLELQQGQTHMAKEIIISR